MLEIEFPPGIQMMFDFLSLLAINLKSILQVECLGNLSFCALRQLAYVCMLAPLIVVLVCADQEWAVRVFVIPLLLVGVAALRFAYVRHTRPEAAEDAAGNFHSHVFGIVFIVYRASADAAQPCRASVSLPCLRSWRVQRGVLYVQLPHP